MESHQLILSPLVSMDALCSKNLLQVTRKFTNPQAITYKRQVPNTPNQYHYSLEYLLDSSNNHYSDSNRIILKNKELLVHAHAIGYPSKVFQQPSHYSNQRWVVRKNKSGCCILVC